MKWLSCAVVLTALGCAPQESGPAGPSVPLEAPEPGQGFQIDEGSFTVEPGVEELRCMRSPIPESYGAGPVYVRGVASQLPPLTHHFFMAYHDEPLDAPESCGTAEDGEAHAGDGKILFITGVGDYNYKFPDGYALYLDSGAGQLNTSHHVINFSQEPAEMYGLFNILTAPAAEIHHPVNVLNCLLRDIWIAPGSEGSVSATCTAPFDLDMVLLSSHAHQFLTRFEIRFFDGEQTLPELIYASETWDSPTVVPLPEPLPIKKGQGLTFSCSYRNTTQEWVTFGAGEYGEMCAIMSSYAMPADQPGTVPPTLGALVFTDGAVVELIETSDIGGQF